MASDWLIQIPLSELVALQALPAKIEELEKDNKQLRRELEGLRNISSQCLQKLGDVCREVKSRSR